MPKKTAARKKTVGADLIEGMKLVVALVAGVGTGRGRGRPPYIC
jgi:hypothetical protein